MRRPKGEWWNKSFDQKQSTLCRKAVGPEKELWEKLKDGVDGFSFVWNAPLLGYFPDFLCEKLMWVIEVDGSGHTGREAYDEERDLKMQKAGYVVTRFRVGAMSVAAMHANILKHVAKARERISRAS